MFGRYSIISAWCVNHGVHCVLQIGKSFEPNRSKTSFRAPDPEVKTFLTILWFAWIHLMILDKINPCLWKLDLGFWTYGFMHLLGPIFPNVVSRPQTPRSRNFLRCHNFLEFILWFQRKWDLFVKTGARVLDFLVKLVVSSPQNLRSRNFFIFHNLIVFIL